MTNTMKASMLDRYGTAESLRLVELPIPVPEESEVLLKVEAAAVNDWDWEIVTGRTLINRMLYGFRKPSVTTLGCDVSGTVVAVGSKVTKFKVGDAVNGDLCVSGFGAFAEYTCAKETGLELKPINMSFIESAALPHAGTLAIQGLTEKTKIKAGQSILFNGAGGGVRTIGIQLLQEPDLDITAVDSGEKLDMLSELGFHHVIDYSKEDFTKNGKGYDFILDVKTTRSPFAYARALNMHGYYVTVGGKISRVLQLLFLAPLIRLFTSKHLCILALKPNKGLDKLNKLCESGKLKLQIDKQYKLEELPAAMTRFSEAKQKGKIVISMS